MRLDRLITLGLANPLRRAMALAPALVRRSAARQRTLPILMYHSISEDPESSFSPYYRVCTSPRRFAEHMQWLAEAGYRGVTLSEGLTWLNAPEPGPEGKMPNPKCQEPKSQSNNSLVGPALAAAPTREQDAARPEKLVAITFDDGFRDFHTAAAPSLQQHGFAATMYLPTAFIDDERKSFRSRECLNWAEVRELAAAGMEFGSHTVNHPVLVNCDWPTIKSELQDSRRTIEDRLRHPIGAFAYPFAFPQVQREFVARFQQELHTAGYFSCVTTEIGTVLPADNSLQLKRLPANQCDDASLLQAKLEGTYDWMGHAQSLAKNLKSLRLRQSIATS